MRQRGKAEKPAEVGAERRAREILGIEDRSATGKDVQVPGLKSKIKLRILSQRQRREAHKAAREWCQRHGFNPEASELSNSGIEFSHAMACQSLVRACLNPKGGFPLWGEGDGGDEAEDELADDLTPEQIRWLEAERQAFQNDVAPPIEEATPELFSEVVKQAKKGRPRVSKDGRLQRTLRDFFESSPRSTLLAFATFLDAQLPSLNGWTFCPSTPTGPRDVGSSDDSD